MSDIAPRAVMASRRSGPDALDFFPTPPWATRALFEEVLKPHFVTPLGPCAWEPCCGAGHMAIPLGEYFPAIFATDVHDWGHGERRDLDFTFAQASDCLSPVDWIITNPPFVLAERILDRALSIAQRGVAMLLRLSWLEGEERWRLIWRGERKPDFAGVFAERVPMIEGVWDPEADTATAYAWFVWHWPFRPMFFTKIIHIAPGAEQRYTRMSDLALATPGEAKRRKAARKAAEG